MEVNSRLNLTVTQIAAVKRTYKNNSMTYRKMQNKRKQIEKLAEEYNALKAETEEWEVPIKNMTQRACGVALNSETVLDLLMHPERISAVIQSNAEQAQQ